MYALLKEYGTLGVAIRNAKHLATNFDGGQDYANHNPCTMVWKLVGGLMELK